MERRAYFLLFAAVVMMFGPYSLSAEDGAKLVNILVQKEPSRLVVTLQVSQPVVYETFTLGDPNRLIFDLQNTTDFEAESLIAVKHMGIQSIRTAQNRPEVVRVVIDFPGDIPPYSIGDSPEGIVVTFREPDPAPEVTPPPVEKRALPETPKPAPVPAPVPKDRPAPFPTDLPKERMLAAGLQGGLYFMHDADFQDIYGKSAVFFGGEGAYFFFLNDMEALGVSLDFKLINAEGQTAFLEDEVNLRLIPFSLSAAYLRKFGRTMPYAALGACLLSYKETYPPEFPISEVSGSTLGIHVQLGTYVVVTENLLFKAYMKFHSLRKEIEEGLTINFGGNEIGVSVCYRFNF